MPWLVSIFCLLGLIVLFFPFVFRIEFSAKYGRVEARFFFFKKRLYECKKLWGKAKAEGEVAKEPDSLSDSNDVDDDFMPEFVPPKPADKKPAESAPVAPKPEAKQEAKPETVVHASPFASAPAPKIVEAPEPVVATASVKPEVEPMRAPVEPAKTAEPPKAAEKTEEPPKAAETGKMDESAPAAAPKPEEPKKPEEKKKPEKRSLTDREFWTILLTPDFDSKAFAACKKLLGAILRLFKIRFKDCYVEGIRMRYDYMGYGAGVNGFLKSFPLVGEWDIRMDWTMDHELLAAGEVNGKINVFRLLRFLLVLLFQGAVLGLSFWRRRRHVLKTNELPELGWLRNKIVGWMVD